MKIRVTIDAQSFEVEVGDLNARPIQVNVEGDSFMVWPEENESVPASHIPQVPPVARKMPEPASQLPAQGGGTAGSKTVTAPIPGVIISITAKVGDSVVFGQELCVLEAMKMKNAIRANRAGKIAAIRVSAGDQVKHSQVLMEFTD